MILSRTLIVGAVLALVVLVPVLLIWSLNTLFALGIQYTAQTWAASLVLGACVRGLSRTAQLIDK